MLEAIHKAMINAMTNYPKTTTSALVLAGAGGHYGLRWLVRILAGNAAIDFVFLLTACLTLAYVVQPFSGAVA